MTGEVITIVDIGELPGGRIEVPCRDRREQVCPPCPRLYNGDTFQVMIAGLRGGHGIPETVGSSGGVRDADRAQLRAGASRAGQLVQSVTLRRPDDGGSVLTLSWGAKACASTRG